MAAISMNTSLRELCDYALSIPSLIDPLDMKCLKDDMTAECLSMTTLRILSRALIEMKKDGKVVSSLHSYITGSKVVFPALKPKVTEVSSFII
jgi:hypothetical protein